MGIQKEGLHEYCVGQSAENEYFADVEYQILRRYHPTGLLCVQMREQDGKRVLLYDVSGFKSLYSISEERGISEEICRDLMKSLSGLFDSLSEYLLDEQHLSLKPEHIYVKGKTVCWMYLPDKVEDMQKEAERLFEWMLSRINYEEIPSVQFIYHAYWYVRNRGFSGEMLRDCLDYKEKERQKPEGYEAFFQKEEPESSPKEVSPVEVLHKVPEKKPEQMVSDKKKKQTAWTLTVLRIICGIAAAATAFAVCWFLFVEWREGFGGSYRRYLIGSVILFLFSAEQLWRLFRNKSGEERKTEQQREEKNEYIPRQATIQDHEWGGEDATVVLGVRKGGLFPALRSADTGRLQPIYTFPFYIGTGDGLNQMVIPDTTVSRRHAVIVRGKQTGSFELQDLRSTNGTWINNERIFGEEVVSLKEGDLLRFAACEYYFVFPGPEGNLAGEEEYLV